MNLLTKTTCGLFLCGALLIAGCGGENSVPSTNFSKLYQTASVAEKYNIGMDKEALNLADNLIVNHREGLDMIVAMQEKIDSGDTELIQKIKDATIRYYARYSIRLQHYPLLNNNGFSLYNRPTKFYQLIPDKEGKFGDHNTSTLREIKSFQSKSSDSASSNPEFLYSTGAFTPKGIWSHTAVWEPSSNELTILWSDNQIYLMSGIHDDKKNHNSICILATPGDIAEGLINGTFPFQEDMTSELLSSFCTFYDDIYLHLPEDVLHQLYVPAKNDKNFMAMSDDDSSFFYVPSLKKLSSDNGDQVYSFQMRFTTGMWGRLPLRTIYIRFRKDGTREWSFNDGKDYYSLNVDWVNRMADYIAKEEHIK